MQNNYFNLIFSLYLIFSIVFKFKNSLFQDENLYRTNLRQFPKRGNSYFVYITYLFYMFYIYIISTLITTISKPFLCF